MFMRSGIALFPFGLSRWFCFLYIYLPNTFTLTFSGDNDYYVQNRTCDLLLSIKG